MINQTEKRYIEDFVYKALDNNLTYVQTWQRLTQDKELQHICQIELRTLFEKIWENKSKTWFLEMYLED